MILNGRLNQALEERSFLMFEFPISGEENFNNRVIPFFENPQITEAKKANYIKYAPPGRSSPMYTYVGADSRILDLEFNITLPHILQVFSKDLYHLTFPFGTKVGTGLSRASFFAKSTRDNPNHAFGYNNVKNNTQTIDIDFLDIAGLETVNDPGQTSIGGTKLRQFVIDIIMYWVNLIRVSVVNNSVTIKDGPPIVRINHGIMYQDVPCICLAYRIDKDENAGYDRNTLLPRVIKVSLQLAEIRHGDFSKYVMADKIKRDNITGWEVIIESKGSMTVDPVPIYRYVNKR